MDIIMFIIAIIFLIAFLFLFKFYFTTEKNSEKSLLKNGKLEIEKASIFYID